MTDYLSSFGLFAVDCVIESDRIIVGMIAIDSDTPYPERVELFDENDIGYWVLMPTEIKYFDLELERV